jgi:hypothetical protein
MYVLVVEAVDRVDVGHLEQERVATRTAPAGGELAGVDEGRSHVVVGDAGGLGDLGRVSRGRRASTRSSGVP